MSLQKFWCEACTGIFCRIDEHIGENNLKYFPIPKACVALKWVKKSSHSMTISFYSSYLFFSVVLGGMVLNKWTVNSVNELGPYTRARRILTPIWANSWNRMAFDNVILSEKKIFSLDLDNRCCPLFFFYYFVASGLFPYSHVAKVVVHQSSEHHVCETLWGFCESAVRTEIILSAWFGSCCFETLPSTNCLPFLIDIRSGAPNTDKPSILFLDIQDEGQWRK